jgi:hypothetical protein
MGGGNFLITLNLLAAAWCEDSGRMPSATQSAIAMHRSRSHDAVIRVYDDF